MLPRTGVTHACTPADDAGQWIVGRSVYGIQAVPGRYVECTDVVRRLYVTRNWFVVSFLLSTLPEQVSST